jgi:hypothetical protein
MGLTEYIRLGANLSRDSITTQTDATGSGSVELGSTYALLSIQTTAPCRLRLYDNSQSLNNVAERNRIFGNTNISASTALIGDFTMSAGIYTIDPVVYGVVNPANTKLTYYRIDNTASAQYPALTFTRYLLEDATISTSNRVSLPNITGSLSVGQIISGSISAVQIPKTYLLVSASLNATTTAARVRLYSTLASINDTTEKNRSFITESQMNSLLVDAIITGSETTHFIPKIIGANLENMGTSLNVLTVPEGKSEIYYIFQSMATTGGAQNMTASIHVVSVEN